MLYLTIAHGSATQPTGFDDGIVKFTHPKYEYHEPILANQEGDLMPKGMVFLMSSRQRSLQSDGKYFLGFRMEWPFILKGENNISLEAASEYHKSILKNWNDTILQRFQTSLLPEVKMFKNTAQLSHDELNSIFGESANMAFLGDLPQEGSSLSIVSFTDFTVVIRDNGFVPELDLDGNLLSSNRPLTEIFMVIDANRVSDDTELTKSFFQSVFYSLQESAILEQIRQIHLQPEFHARIYRDLPRANMNLQDESSYPTATEWFIANLAYILEAKGRAMKAELRGQKGYSWIETNSIGGIIGDFLNNLSQGGVNVFREYELFLENLDEDFGSILDAQEPPLPKPH